RTHHSPHFFPTRRSSDLNVPLSTKWNFEAANRVARRYLELSREADDVDVIIWPESPLPFFIDQMGARFYDEVVSLPAPLLSGFLDRKSTRLNSSHVKISY